MRTERGTAVPTDRPKVTWSTLGADRSLTKTSCLPLIIGQRLCCCGTADRGVWTPTVQAAASHRGEVSCAVPPSEDIDLK